MTTRNYSSTAADTALAAPMNDSQTSMTVDATTGFPAAPYILVIDPGTVSQELVLVTGVAGTTLTVTRGYDSTSAVSHLAAAVVQHSHAAIDFRETAAHIDATDGVHGVTGDLVGTTDTQTLTNKTLTTPTLSGYTASRFVTTDGAGEIGASTKAIPTGDVVGTSDAQTLTNKTLALGSNTVSGTKAQFNTAMTDADFATLAGTETLTNKTLNLANNTVTGTLTQFNTALSGEDFATQSDVTSLDARLDALEAAMPETGTGSQTTNASGQFTLNHSLGVTPKFGWAGAAGNRLGQMTSATSTTATFTIRNYSDGALQASITTTYDWVLVP